MKDKFSIDLVVTEDGSHSLFIPELDETYHSTHGAIQESRHVYIDAGMRYIMANKSTTKEIRLLEFGFGTGLNCLLTAIEHHHSGKIVYHTLEKYPLPTAIITGLNYGEVLNEVNLFKDIHAAPWETEQNISKNFILKKIKADFRDYKSKLNYDLIYFDAFAPSKQPELWNRAIFEKCHSLLNDNGVLVTYSAKGQLKRDLQAIGFTIESLPGPPGKFEITRAIKR